MRIKGALRASVISLCAAENEPVILKCGNDLLAGNVEGAYMYTNVRRDREKWRRRYAL